MAKQKGKASSTKEPQKGLSGLDKQVAHLKSIFPDIQEGKTEGVVVTVSKRK